MTSPERKARRPRYDRVYFEGLAWLESVARTDYWPLGGDDLTDEEKAEAHKAALRYREESKPSERPAKVWMRPK